MAEEGGETEERQTGDWNDRRPLSPTLLHPSVCGEPDPTVLVLVMLSSLVKEHQVRQQAKKEEIEKKKQDALVAANNLTSALVDHLNEG